MAREPAAIRYKNPGAMWPGAVATKWGSKRWVYLNDGTGQGGNGKGNKIAIFDSWVDGICAQLDLWRTSPRYRNKPFSQAIAVWSGGNHVESYIRYVLARIPGMTRDTVMNDAFWKSPNGIKFLKVQAGHEAGKPIPAPDADYIEAQRRVMGVGAKVEKAVIPTTTTVVVEEAARAAGFPWEVAIGFGVAVLVGFFLWNVYKQYKTIKELDAQIDEAAKSLSLAPPPEVTNE